MNTTQAEAIASANAYLTNAGLLNYDELVKLLIEARDLGLTFDVGSAYISRRYIDKQDELVAHINAAIK